MVGPVLCLLLDYHISRNTIPVSLNNGFKMPAWFDIKGLDISAAEDVEGIKKATTYVHSLIEKEISEGIPSERIMIGGFSQGGALAIHSALTFPKKLAGIIALSCWLPMSKAFNPSLVPANKDIHIIQCHGDCDPIVSYSFGQLTASVLKNVTKNLAFKTYNGMMHSSSDEEMIDMKNFISARLPSV
ncbi:hypothetical protein V9T40_001831 [Parthenolecanium corni]|uniref:palmitoyl-protein hydrolase n=1 Tax=Parthenolecanium corni TaxID=536013 RepID=A0AAN9TF39_9HEMI